MGWVGGLAGGGGVVGRTGCGWVTGLVVHDANINAPKKAVASTLARILGYLEDIGESSGMWVIFVEAGAALALFLFIVWWTMFSGRNEDPASDHDADDDQTR